MDFELPDELLELRDSVRRLAQDKVKPRARAIDKEGSYPTDIFEAFRDAGLLGLCIPVEFGGSGAGILGLALAIEEVAKYSNTAALMLLLTRLPTGPVMIAGTTEQKQRYLPGICEGTLHAAFGLSEPQAGSDVMGMRTRGTPDDGGGWVLNGTKCWITHGISSDVVVVIVRTGELLDSKGMTAFVVERGTPGLKAGKKENKLGMRSSETAEVIFEDCRVPEANILGQVGEGFQQAMKVLDGGRISIAALSLGIAKGAYDASVKYAKEREAFGRPISAYQGVSFKIARMEARAHTARLAYYRAAALMIAGREFKKEAAIAKLIAGEAAMDNAREDRKSVV